MEKQLTAVEYIKEKLMCDEYWYENMTFDEIFEQAKEMEKKQIENAFENGMNAVNIHNLEQYYNETFKQQEQ
jgi:hypothetical protein